MTTYENTYNNIGLNGTYPLDSGDPTEFPSAITGPVIVYRMMVRFPDPIYDHYPGMKFLTQDGTGGESIFLLIARAGDEDVHFYQFDYTTSYTDDGDVPGFRDGEWHALAFRIEKLSADQLQSQVWFNDWAMGGPPSGNGMHNIPNFGEYDISVLLMNFGGDNPNDPLAIDIDNFEVWDGDPSGGAGGANTGGSGGNGGASTGGSSGAPAGGNGGAGGANSGGSAGTITGGTGATGGVSPAPQSTSDDDGGCGCRFVGRSRAAPISLLFGAGL